VTGGLATARREVGVVDVTAHGDARDGPGRLLFVADGRSPIARNWIAHFVASGHEVHLASTFPCDAVPGVASLHILAAAFGGLAGGGRSTAASGPRSAIARTAGRVRTALFPAVFGWLAPLDVAPHVRRLRALVRRIDPALVHAMRIPYEGVVAGLALESANTPLVVSTWGNDLELWAARYPFVGRLTRRALARATALHADCARDLRLATRWGWNASRPSAVIPGNGGVRTPPFYPGPPDPATTATYELDDGRPLVLNPRGMRGYVRNDTFFRAIPLVLERRPDVVFAGIGMRDHPTAQRMARATGHPDAVRLLPAVSPATMGELFRAAAIAVSPAVYDGTPNTLLEAMACGALPVAGDIASVREWITPGENGLLFDPRDPRALADALLRGLADEELRRRAAARNWSFVRERADYGDGMRRAEALYAAAVTAAVH